MVLGTLTYERYVHTTMELLPRGQRVGTSEFIDGRVVDTTVRRVCNGSRGICGILKVCVRTGVIDSLGWHREGIVAGCGQSIVVLGITPSLVLFERIVLRAKTRLERHRWKMLAFAYPLEETSSDGLACHGSSVKAGGQVAVFIIMRDVAHAYLTVPIDAQEVCYFLSGGGDRREWHNNFPVGDWFIQAFSPSELGRWFHDRWTVLCNANIMILDQDGLEYVRGPMSMATRKCDLDARWRYLVGWRQCVLCGGIDGSFQQHSTACENCLWMWLIKTLWDYDLRCDCIVVRIVESVDERTPNNRSIKL